MTIAIYQIDLLPFLRSLLLDASRAKGDYKTYHTHCRQYENDKVKAHKRFISLIVLLLPREFTD